MASVVVIGGGVGGLCAAIRLRSQGHDVSIIERQKIGGKLETVDWTGYRFDTGPSLLTLPDVFDELFGAAGKQLDDYLELIAIEEPFEYRFWEGSSFKTSTDIEKTYGALEEFAPGAGEQWSHYLLRAERIWETSFRTFFAGPMDSWKDMVRRMKSPRDLFDIDPFMTLAGRSEQSFNDPRMQAWLNRYATYSGSNPFSAPATLGCIPYIEHAYGCWHVRGGLGMLAMALQRLCNDIDVQIIEGVGVNKVAVRNERVVGVETTNGPLEADIVISDVDSSVLYTDLLPNEALKKKLAVNTPSSSVLAISLAVADKTPNATHHTVWFAKDQRQEFAAIFGGKGWTEDCTIYACNPVVTDKTMAPENHEALTILVNVGAGTQTDWNAFAARIIERIGLTGRIVKMHLTTPQDLEMRFNNPGGAIYGTSSNSMRAAFMRASNRGPVRGLYATGGSAHPGGGLPLVAMSARIVSDMIKNDRDR